MSSLKLYLLGPPRIELDGESVEIKRRKTLALLIYLAVTGRRHLRPTLASLLWADMPETVAMTNLRKSLTNSRKLIDPHLNITRQDVTFKRDSANWLDVERFEASTGTISAEGPIDQLQQAVTLYQGDFLEGFYIRNAPEFEAWALAQRTHLRELAVQALYRLAIHYTEQGERGWAIAIDYTRRLLTLEPWREEAHRQMMLLLALAGQRSAALTQYETCHQLLAEELGVEPGEATRVLYERIRDGDLSRAQADLTHPASTPRHNLPAQLTPLIGREAELAELVRLLANPDPRLITILGPGGMGKTRLALEVATDQRGHFEHGVYLVPLAPLEVPEVIVSTIAEALNFPFSGEGSPQHQLLNYLRPKQMLLVLDNFEHLLEGAKLVVQLLETAAGLKILITSRARLKVQGEQLFPLSGMEVPQLGQAVSLAETGQTGSIQLFLRSVHQLVPDFEITAENVQSVVQICRLVEGMPLGILLAAAWVEVLTPAEIVAEIGQGFDFLESDLQDVEERQQSLRVVFDHSWRLLTKQERTIFAGLSVFRGGFTREAAAAVMGASPRDLLALLNKSLLHHASTGRYQMHELLRQYAQEQLVTLEKSNEAHEAHCGYYIDFLHKCEVDLKGARQQEILAEIKADGENVRAAWSWAVQQGKVAWLDRAMESLGRFYEWRGRNQDGVTACQLVLVKLKATESADGLRVLARSLAWQATFRLKSDYEFAEQLLQQSLALLDGPTLADQDTRSERAFVLRQLGIIACLSDYKKAKHLYRQSLALYQSLGDQWGTANVLDVLGWAFLHTGDFDRAKQFLQESLAIRRVLGDPRAVANSLFALGFNAARQGQNEEVEQLVHEYLAVIQKSSNRASLAQGFFHSGSLLCLIGKFRESLPPLENSLSISIDLGLNELIAQSNLWQGATRMRLGQYERARTQIRLAMTRFRASGDRILTGVALSNLGCILIAVEMYAEAYDLLQEGSAIVREIGHLTDLSCRQACLGYAARGLGNNRRAHHHLSEALQIATEIRFVGALQYALPAIALLLTDRDEVERAVELCALATCAPYVANSRWFEDVAGQHIAAAAAATLAAEVVTAAQQRGRSRDLWQTAAELLAEFKAIEACGPTSQ